MNKMERKVVSFGKPPKGYVAGVGRGAKPISRSISGKRKRDDDEGAEPSLKRRNVDDEEEKKTGHWIDRVEGEEDNDSMDKTKFMAFNLKDERSEGKYLADGSYVLFKDNEKLDPWLEDVVKNDIVYEEKKKTTTKEEEKPKMTVNEAAMAIRNVLSVNETVTAAMQRLAKLFRVQKSKKPWLKNSKRNKNTNTTESDALSQTDRDAAKKQFEKLTEAADIFLLNGLPNIYECTLSILERKLKSSGISFQNPWAIGQRVRMVRLSSRSDLNGQYAVILSPFDFENGRFRVCVETTREQINVKSVNLEATVQQEEKKVEVDDGLMWEYKWKEDSKEIHGPYVVVLFECVEPVRNINFITQQHFPHRYTTTMMKNWKSQGYFVGQYKAFVRKWKPAQKNSEKAKDTDVQSLMNDLEDSDDEEEDSEKKSEWFLSTNDTF